MIICSNVHFGIVYTFNVHNKACQDAQEGLPASCMLQSLLALFVESENYLKKTLDSVCLL